MVTRVVRLKTNKRKDNSLLQGEDMTCFSTTVHYTEQKYLRKEIALEGGTCSTLGRHLMMLC